MILMRFAVQTAFSAVRQVLANKVRAFLTTLGIIIGVWAITTVIAAVGGLNDYVLNKFASFGANKIFIWGEVPESKRGLMSWEKVKIKASEAKALRDSCHTLSKAGLATRFRAPIRYGQNTKGGVVVNAMEPDAFDVEDFEIINGRKFSESDDRGALQVCIVNDKAIDELLLENQGLGQYIFINENRFLIIGVLKTKQLGPMFGGGDAKSEVYVPYGVMPRLRADWWPEIRALMKSPDDADEARKEITYYLRNSRQLAAGEDNTFNMFIFESILSNLRSIGTALTGGTAVLVGISLLVGGIGIMNIMLVSVSERTREIGLRKAVGANPAVILIQFLIEAVILCLMGGIVGLVLGQATTLGLTKIPDSPLQSAEIPMWAIVLAFGFSAGVGVIFGMWPAVKASRLDPIEALRHE